MLQKRACYSGLLRQYDPMTETDLPNIASDTSAEPSGAANQQRARAYNERLVLSLVRRHGGLSKAAIAKRSGLSAQAVSVIIKSLEKDKLLVRGEPVRGKVGQPSIPLSLNPDGVYLIGLKIGRRSAHVVLLDFVGCELASLQTHYDYPTPKTVLMFSKRAIKKIKASLTKQQQRRIAGVGVSTPFELWNWAEKIQAPAQEMLVWKAFDFKKEFSSFCDFPVFIENDATAACAAELVFGHGGELADFIYFFIGTFIGGGIVLNHAVFRGRSGNAAAVGSMPVVDSNGVATQLIDHASVLALEERLVAADLDATSLYQSPNDWSDLGKNLDEWINNTSKHLALAIASSCAVIDFTAVILDGAIPTDVRAQLLDATKQQLIKLNPKGIRMPDIYEGQVGAGARAIGGACQPLIARYLLDQNVLFGEPR